MLQQQQYHTIPPTLACGRRSINGSKVLDVLHLTFCRGLVAGYPMLDVEAANCPSIVYRPLRPSDLEVLVQVHAALFPIRYDMQFFISAVYDHGIVSWAAVDTSRPGSQGDELIGFVTTCIISAKESEIENLLRYDASRKDQVLVYILTIGVVDCYRNLGIATSLVQEVIKYASGIPTCSAVYLHVIDYNQPAINFYRKVLFKLERKLPRFYYINGQHYASYLFVCYVNGGRSPRSVLEIVAAVGMYARALLKLPAAKLWKNEEKKMVRWSKCRETCSLLVTHSNKIHSAENDVHQCV